MVIARLRHDTVTSARIAAADERNAIVKQFHARMISPICGPNTRASTFTGSVVIFTGVGGSAYTVFNYLSTTEMTSDATAGAPLTSLTRNNPSPR